jgi:hypothetical protein
MFENRSLATQFQGWGCPHVHHPVTGHVVRPLACHVKLMWPVPVSINRAAGVADGANRRNVSLPLGPTVVEETMSRAGLDVHSVWARRSSAYMQSGGMKLATTRHLQRSTRTTELTAAFRAYFPCPVRAERRRSNIAPAGHLELDSRRLR